jgi:hypothetical protein
MATNGDGPQVSLALAEALATRTVQAGVAARYYETACMTVPFKKGLVEKRACSRRKNAEDIPASIVIVRLSSAACVLGPTRCLLPSNADATAFDCSL